MAPVVTKILVIALVLVLILALGLFGLDRYARAQAQDLSKLPTREIVAHGQTLTLLVADTPETVGPGLSGQERLPDDAGLLLISPDGDTRVTMLGMRFPLDVIWLDDAGTVLALRENVSAAPLPLWYSPPQGATRVIELNAGGTERYDIEVGDQLPLDR